MSLDAAYPQRGEQHFATKYIDYSAHHYVLLPDRVLASWLIYARAFVASLHPLAATHFGARLGAFFYGTRFIWSVRQYYFDLSDQSALEIRVRITVRLKDALF